MDKKKPRYTCDHCGHAKQSHDAPEILFSCSEEGCDCTYMRLRIAS